MEMERLILEALAVLIIVGMTLLRGKAIVICTKDTLDRIRDDIQADLALKFEDLKRGQAKETFELEGRLMDKFEKHLDGRFSELPCKGEEDVQGLDCT